MDLNLTGADTFSNLANAMNKLKSNENKVLEIELNRIERDPNQPRKYFDDDAIIALAEDIKLHGLIQPIVVRENPEDSQKFYIVAGERRYRAAQLLEMKTLKAIVGSKGWKDEDIGYIQVSENTKRSDLKYYELAEFILGRKEKGEKNVEIAERLGIDPKDVSRYLTWENAPEEIKHVKDRFKHIRVFSDFVKFYNENIELATKLLEETEGSISKAMISSYKKKAEAEDNYEDQIIEQELASEDTNYIEQFSQKENKKVMDEVGASEKEDLSIFDKVDASKENVEDADIFDNGDGQITPSPLADDQIVQDESVFEPASTSDDYSDNDESSSEQVEFSSDESELNSDEDIYKKDETDLKFKKPVIKGYVDSRKCDILFKKKPSTEGFICVKYEDGFEAEVLAETIKLNRIVEA